MIRLSWGRNQQIHFSKIEEYYMVLGYLAKSDGSTELNWENNEDQGAWGSEGRIHFYEHTQKFPHIFKYTAGRGNVTCRVNCNDFVEHLNRVYGYVMGKRQDKNSIRAKIPAQYQQYFDAGLKL